MFGEFTNVSRHPLVYHTFFFEVFSIHQSFVQSLSEETEP